MIYYKLMKRKGGVKYYWAQNRANSKDSMILADYGNKKEVTLAWITNKTGAYTLREEHFPPCDKSVVDEIIKGMVNLSKI